MKNLDTPDSPIFETNGRGELEPSSFGLTKRERACIDLRIPESGDPELDALIKKAQRQEMAAKAMQGILSCHEACKYKDVAVASTRFADALLAEPERTDG